MLFLTWYLLVPLLWVLACLILIWRRPGSLWRRGGLYGQIAFALALLIGFFAIYESRSSTAGIGLLFLPVMALVPGVLGFALGMAHYLYRQQAIRPVWALPVMLLTSLLLVACYGYQGYGWWQTAQQNTAQDREAERQRQSIADNRRLLAEKLAANPGREAAIIEQLASQTDDRTWLIPLAANPHASVKTLDELSRSADFGVALNALRNPKLPADSIVRLYREHSYPDYFFSTMAGNANSPVWLLRALYEMRAQNLGIAPALAANTASPDDLLADLLATADQRTLGKLAGNPRIDCGQLFEIERRLQDHRLKRPGSPLARRLAVCRQ